MIIYEVKIYFCAFMQHRLHELNDAPVRLVPVVGAAPIRTAGVLMLNIKPYCVVDDAVALLAAHAYLLLQLQQEPGIYFYAYLCLVYHVRRKADVTAFAGKGTKSF